MLAVRGRRILTFWLAFVLGLAALPALAAAGDGKTIVLLGVEGERAPRLKNTLEQMIKSQHEILPGSVYRDAARRLRAEKLTPNNVKKVCAYLKVDGVVDGTVVEDEAGYTFILRLRSAANGIIEKKIPMRLNAPILREPMANKLSNRLLPAIADLPAVDKDGEDATRVAAARTGKRPSDDAPADPEISELGDSDGRGKGRRASAGDDDGDDDDGRRGKRRRTSSRDDGDEDADGEEGGRGDDGERVASSDDGDSDDSSDDSDSSSDSDDGDSDSSIEGSADSLTARQTTPRTTPLLLSAGVSFVGRNLTFAYDGVEGMAPPGFSGSLVPGAYVVGELYPAAFGGERGGVADLGIGFVVDRAIGLTTGALDDAGNVTDVDTSMWRYGVNARYRHNFDDEPNGVSVQAVLGFTSSGFSINKGQAPNGIDVPNVGYRTVDIGGGGRLPLVGKLSFLGEAKVLAPLDAGPIQRTSQYGPATVFGVDAEAGFELQITRSFLARAGARLMLVKLTFDGDGSLDDRDGDGTQDVASASDRYLGGFVTGGYAF